MSMKVLMVEEMVSVSGPMVDPAHADNAALAAVPAAAALLPALTAAHDALFASHVAAQPPERLAEIAAELARLDDRHDDLVRGIYQLLSGESWFASTDSERREILALRDHLLPDGMNALNRSYRVEAGQAALLAARLDAADRALLATFPTRNGSLRARVDEWLALASQIGALEDERTPAGHDGPGAVAARNQWIRTVRTLQGVLELVAASDPTIARILARIAEVERRADDRAATRRQAALDADADADADTDADADDAPPVSEAAPPPAGLPAGDPTLPIQPHDPLGDAPSSPAS